MTYRFKEGVNAIAFKYFTGHCPSYLNEVFETSTENNFQSGGSFQDSKCPLRKTNTGQLALTYSGPIFWNKTPDTFKRTNNCNTFKHNFKNLSGMNLKIVKTF